MEPMRIDEVLEATGGALAAGEAEGAVGAVCIDSRRARPGGLLIALKGVRFDGHDYIPEALRKGCRAVVFSSPDVPARTAARGIAFIRVADTLDAFARIAQRHRSRFELPLVAVTGSNGKTTTKEMIRAIAASRFSVLASEGTFNNFVGVPLTLLRIEAWHSLAVLELGMNARGEIRRLAEIAAPDVGVVTNVGPPTSSSWRRSKTSPPPRRSCSMRWRPPAAAGPRCSTSTIRGLPRWAGAPASR